MGPFVVLSPFLSVLRLHNYQIDYTVTLIVHIYINHEEKCLISQLTVYMSARSLKEKMAEQLGVIWF